MTRTILHADMDAFYAAVEQRDDPTLRGKPVIVAGLGRRGVVSTASYEARRFGVRSAMPTAEARRRCPEGVFVPPRMEAYAAESEVVQAIFARYTPLVEPLSLDEAFLDVTASRALFGDGAAIAARIRDDVRKATSLSVSLGVAATKFVAKVASDLRKPGGLVVVPPGGEREFLAPLPVSRLWGAGRVTEEKLIARGWTTIGALAAAADAELVRVLGAAGAAHFAALARGEDPRDVVPSREALSVGRETTFDVDLADDDALDQVLVRLSESVGSRLRAAQFSASVVRLKIRFPPFETHTRQTKLPTPTDDDLVVLRVARGLLAAARSKRRPVRLVGVTGAALVPTSEVVRQTGLFDAPAEAPERTRRLSRAVDDLRARFGDGVIRRAAGEPGPSSPERGRPGRGPAP